MNTSDTTTELKQRVMSAAKTAGHKLHQHQTVAVGVVALAIIGFSIFSIRDLLSPELDQAVYEEQLQATKPISFDAEAIEAIRNLEDSAGPVQTDLPDNRVNPF